MPSPDGGIFGAPSYMSVVCPYRWEASVEIKGRGTAVMPLPMAMPIGALLIRGPRNFSTEKLDLGEPK